jgi:hypothetical protein
MSKDGREMIDLMMNVRKTLKQEVELELNW